MAHLLDATFDSLARRYSARGISLDVRQSLMVIAVLLVAIVTTYIATMPSTGEKQWLRHQADGLGTLVATHPTVVFRYTKNGRTQTLDLKELSPLWRANQERLGVCTNDPIWHYRNVPGLFGNGTALMFDDGALVAPAPELQYDPIYLDDSTFIKKVNER